MLVTLVGTQLCWRLSTTGKVGLSLLCLVSYSLLPVTHRVTPAYTMRVTLMTFTDILSTIVFLTSLAVF